MTNMRELLRLYLILESDMLIMPLERFIPAVVDGGVSIIQLRDKSRTPRERFHTARSLSRLLESTGVPLVINDRADIAAATRSPFVHIGAEDLHPAPLKKAFGGLRYGYSCNTPDDIHTALQYNADYIGVGPAFATTTKSNLRPVIGPEGIARLLEHTNTPAVAIGGITSANIHELTGSGISGVAVSRALCASTDPRAEAEKLRKAVDAL